MNTDSVLRQSTPEKVASAFLTPVRMPGRPTLDSFPGGQRCDFKTSLGRIAAVRGGNGPKVLLVHGWDGISSDMFAFANPLISAGYEVIAIDLPAHGESEGSMASIPQAAQCLSAIQETVGTLHAVISHSVGTAVTVHAMGAGLDVARAVLLCPPARMQDFVLGLSAQAGLSREQARQVIEILQNRYDVDASSVNTPKTAKQLTQKSLILHSEDDRIVPIKDAEEIALAWAGSILIKLQGLGHRRILQDQRILKKVVSFVNADQPLSTD